MDDGSNPAARKSGSANLRMVVSISASRIIEIRFALIVDGNKMDPVINTAVVKQIIG